ncbi:DUF3470 domain-containing protein [Bradyrhizobium sp. I71]|nr:DUF3470 domain-containing protein [Bradyrhizobium sp. I71]
MRGSDQAAPLSDADDFKDVKDKYPKYFSPLPAD